MLLLYEALKVLPLPPSVTIQPLFAFTIFGIVELLFNQWGWRLLSYFPPLHIYNFGGTYEGRIRAGDGNDYPAILTIKQTWSQIELYFESGEAKSKSFSASITQDRLAKGHVEIIYNYFAPGTHKGEERVGAHYGTTMFKRLDKGARLEGDYFTEQKRDTFGQITLRRKS